ncbi:MAG: leucyl/phenylalanyl-tRNA--protein transferase [Acidobacteriota bacterium]
MPIRRFPDPREANPDGIVALGGDLHPESLILAYQSGIFPWPIGGYPLVWFSPDPRAILRFDEIHVPRRLARVRRLKPYRLTIDGDFDGVIRACARVHAERSDGTWILPEMIEAYTRLHWLGHAHSVEARSGGGLVGGIYGVDAGGAFAAESMFYTAPNASKLALLHLIEHLSSRGLEWLDIQVMTPHMARFGAREIPRDDFLRMLAESRARGLKLFG